MPLETSVAFLPPYNGDKKCARKTLREGGKELVEVGGEREGVSEAESKGGRKEGGVGGG